MGDNAQYVQFGFILISVTNLIMIGLLIIVFALAVLLRRPGEQRVSTLELPSTSVAAGTDTTGWEEQL
jgi:mannose/fructose/N-acetylgalactosamine-specific phosphotransferase system component IIC